MQGRRKSLGWAGAVAAIAVLGFVAAGCGSTEEQDPTPVATFKITPASGTPATEPTSATTQAVETPDGATTPANGGANEPITIVAQNIEFDTDEISASAGTVVIIFDNQDIGQPHNVHFFEGENNDGETVGETDIRNGPAEDTLEMELESDTYYYQCDAHPTMKGILTVT
jgi:plastocyanin